MKKRSSKNSNHYFGTQSPAPKSPMKRHSWFSSRDLKAMIPDIKEQACKCGADAVIMKNSKAADSSWAGMGGSLSGQSTSVGIKFKEKPSAR